MKATATNSIPKIPPQKLPLFIGVISAGFGFLIFLEGIVYLFGVVSVQDEVVQKHMKDHCNPPYTITGFERRLCTNWRLEYASGVMSILVGLVQGAASVSIIVLAQKLRKYWWLNSALHGTLTILLIIPTVCAIDVYRDRKGICNGLVNQAENRPCSGCGYSVSGSKILRQTLPNTATLDDLAACTFRHLGNPRDLQLADAFVVFYFLCLTMDLFFCLGAGTFLLFFGKAAKSQGQGMSETVFTRPSQASAFGDGTSSAVGKSAINQMQPGQDGPPPA